MCRHEADVIIIGGGLIGASAALFLARRGRSVILLERGYVGAQASGVNFGNCRRQGRLLAQLPLANRARGIWGRLAELTGGDAEFMPVGHLRVCYDPEQIGVIEDYADRARAYGLNLELLSRSALHARFGYVGAEAIAGSFSPLDGHANPRLATPLFARAARQMGVRIHEMTEVLACERVAEDFVVNVAGGGHYRAPAVLVAAGAWGGRFAAHFGEDVPMRPKGPQMAVTEPMPYVIGPVTGVSTATPGEVVYLRQIPRGNIIYGGCMHGPADLDTARATYVAGNAVAQFRQVLRLAPVCARARVIRTWSGVEGYVDDGRPVMGCSARVPGLFHAFGFCGHGFQIGPGVGDVMAELIDTGATTTPIDAFSIARFQQGRVRAS